MVKTVIDDLGCFQGIVWIDAVCAPRDRVRSDLSETPKKEMPEPLSAANLSDDKRPGARGSKSSGGET